MKKQEKARIRNWTKMRLMGLVFHSGIPLTIDEKYLLAQIDEYRKILLKSWDANTDILKSKNWSDEQFH